VFLLIISRIFKNLKWILIYFATLSTLVDESPDHIQVELIDPKSSNDMKRVFDENDLVSF